MPETASQTISVPASVSPPWGHIFAFITCTRTRWEQDEDGDTLEDPIQEHGWIDRSWSPYVLHESRNDVSPVVDCPEEDDERLHEEVSDALGWLEGGAEDNGNATFYAREGYTPFQNNAEGWEYSYALHFVRKSQGARGYIEEPWIPPMAMRS